MCFLKRVRRNLDAMNFKSIYPLTTHLLDLGRVPAVNQLGRRTDSSRCWAQVSEWILACTTQHKACIRKHTWRDFVPTRLVDIGLPNRNWPPESVRIVDTKTEAIRAPYITLSHCWGEESFVKLNDDNLQEYTTTGVPWTEVETNRNFADVLQAASNLGVRYVWIDSLCIIQNQPGSADFKKEALRMHLVYRNSYCNIASADSTDHKGGLFRDRGSVGIVVPASFTPHPGTALFRKKGKWRVLPANLYDDELMSKILYTRAWVFQGTVSHCHLRH
jgi:hypothetical protein